MAQYLKAEVRERILEAGLREFATHGFEGATMAGIARTARISTGNIYRYYEGKKDLLRAAVPEAWVDRFRVLLHRRVEAAAGLNGLPDPESSHPYVRAGHELLEFAIEHRLRLLILLKSTGGGPFADERRRVTAELITAALRHFGVNTADERGPTFAFGLREIYRNYVASLVRVLETFAEPGDIRDAVATYERYHLVGLKAFFDA